MSRRSTLQHLAAEIQHLKHALANLEQMRPPKSSPNDYAEPGKDQAFAFTRFIRGARMNTQAEILYLAVWRSAPLRRTRYCRLATTDIIYDGPYG